MGINRRDFLRVTGVGTLLGLGGGVVRELGIVKRVEAGTYQPQPNALTARRWAMVVDMRKCLEKVNQDGCQDCILACHAVHNVPKIQDPKHEVKWLWKEPYENTFPSQHHEFTEERLHGQPFLALCNHCDKPPCVRVCPTQATFRRPDGIVVMDYHRCIGCRYCMAACPYGSRSFNWSDPRKALEADKTNPGFPTRTKGVVEKCNFCDERLAEGLPPRCVEVCTVKALTFGDLEDPESDVRKLLRSYYTVQRKPELGTKPEIFYIV